MSDGDITDRQIAVLIMGDSDKENLVRAGTVLVAALRVGPNNKRIAERTGIPIGDVGNYGYRLRRAGIWRDRTMYYPWLDDGIEGRPEAAIGFVVQAMVATGELVRYEDDSFRVARIGEGQGAAVEWTEGAPPRNTLVRERLTKPRKVLV